MVFTDAERAYLESQRLGRIATTSKAHEPDVAPVGFSVDGDDIVVGGIDITNTRKYHNVRATGRASFVVDDLVSTDPWTPRLVKVTGRAEVEDEPGGRPVLRVHPETVWSFGLGGDGSGKRKVA
jgi:pyridoxamine 5'-phosphate oxidase family protein